MRARATIAAGLALATCIVYLRVRDHAFLEFDDARYILENPQVASGFGLEGVRRAFGERYSQNWIPLTTLSWQIDRSLYGFDPTGFHLTNVALHAASAVLLFLALARMSGSLWPCAFVAGLFALHPLHVESVAWAAERKDTLSGFFWMLTLLLYARYVERPGAARYLALCVSFAAGLLAKPMLVTLPCVLLLLDYWPLRRRVSRAIPEKLPLLALSAASSVVTFLVQRAGGAMQLGERIPFELRLANALESYVVYVVKFLWPTGLAAYYPHPLEAIGWTGALAAGALLLVVSAAAVALAGKRPYLLVGWLWYLGTLIPVIGLVQVGTQARADRYTYIPLVGLALMVAFGADDLLARWRAGRRPLAALGGAALAACAVASWFQLAYWRDTIALHERSLAVNESNPRAHYGLAMALTHAGRPDEALAHYEEAIRLAPRWPLPYLELAKLRAERGERDGALAAYARALELDPDDGNAHANAGLLLAQLGRAAEARPHLERALELHARSPELQRQWSRTQVATLEVALGNIAALAGDADAALARYQQALAVDPEHRRARANRGLTLLHSGRPAEAFADLAWAAPLEPDTIELQLGLAQAAEALGRTPLAVQQYRKVLALAPRLASVANNLAWLLATAREPEVRDGAEAVRLAEELAARGADADPALLDTLAAAYAATGRYPEAVRDAERAVTLALSRGDAALAEEVRGHLALYAAGRPYVAPPAPSAAGTAN